MDPDGLAEAYPADVNALMANSAAYAQIVGVTGRTPLMVAAAEGHVEACRCLLDLGADPERLDSAGRRAVDYAKNGLYGGNGQIVRLLV